MGRVALTPFYDLAHVLAGLGRVHAEMIRQAEVRPGQRVLDVGCGTGNLLLAVGAAKPGVELEGLDPDARILATAGRKSRRARLPVTWRRGFADDLPFADGAVDRVFSSLMLHHLAPAAAKAGMLAEVRRVLAPDGLLVLADVAGHDALRDHAAPGHGPHGRGLRGRRMARSEPVGDNAGMVEQIAEAGFTLDPPTRVGLRLGDITIVRARPAPGAAGGLAVG